MIALRLHGVKISKFLEMLVSAGVRKDDFHNNLMYNCKKGLDRGTCLSCEALSMRGNIPGEKASHAMPHRMVRIRLDMKN